LFPTGNQKIAQKMTIPVFNNCDAIYLSYDRNSEACYFNTVMTLDGDEKNQSEG
jgi:hypothetical protein